MKNYIKGALVASLALVTGVTCVNAATATKNIDSTTCETVYTNYYFFLDANTKTYFNQGELSDIYHNTIAEYHNNSYLTNFDTNNIGYGKMDVSTTSTTSKDGISSMSLTDYYNIALKSHKFNGAFTEGNNNYIVSHNWYRVNNDGTTTPGGKGFDYSQYSTNALIGATVNAKSDFTVLSNISKSAENPFKIRINRNYTGYLTSTPLKSGSSEWYLQPAVYYIQYCAPKEVGKYTIEYDGNADGVANVPSKQVTTEGQCTNISNVKPARTGYTFLGWSRSADSTVADDTYAPGKEYCGTEGNIKLFAIWKKETRETYTVYYRENTTDTVSNMPLNETVDVNNDTSISNNTPQRNGYTFVGWSTDAKATSRDEAFVPGAPYTDRKDLELFAIWKKNDAPVLPENPKTGISDYIIPVSGVIGASGIGLGILKKKKNIFKQL